MKQVLVEWKGIPLSSATWEDENSLVVAYPEFNLEDKVEVEGGNIDMSSGQNSGFGEQSGTWENNDSLSNTWEISKSLQQQRQRNFEKPIGEEISITKGRARREIKKPERFRE